MRGFILLLLLIPLFMEGQYITKEEASADVKEFEELVKNHSSYYELEGVSEPFESALLALKDHINSADSMEVNQLYFALEKIMADIPDRHASVKYEGFEEDDYEVGAYHFPMSLARYYNELVALKFNRETKEFVFYDADYPYIEAIDGMSVIDFIDKYAYPRKSAPIQSKLNRGASDLRDIGELLIKQNELDKRSVIITFANEQAQIKNLEIPFVKEKMRWLDKSLLKMEKLKWSMAFSEEIDFDDLFELREDSIGVFKIPSMVADDDYPGILAFYEEKIKACLSLKGVIIDVRSNGGGGREILHVFAPYLIKSSESPWVANKAYVRQAEKVEDDMESMSGRYLFPIEAAVFDEADKKAIDKFNRRFKPPIKFDESQFSEAFYMVLRSGDTQLDCPVFILTNERCFSAASVFISSLKGLENVKIVGVNSDGSSGRSQKVFLKHSNIRIKLSTMLSLQRNGYPLDGYGTQPDILIDRSMDQVLGKEDYQLKEAIRLIKE